MSPKSALTSSFSVTDANNEVVCPLLNQDGSNCRKRCTGVSRGVFKHSKQSLTRWQGETIPLDARTHSTRTSRLLHTETSGDGGEFRSHDHNPADAQTTTRPFRPDIRSPQMYVYWVDIHRGKH